MADLEHQRQIEEFGQKDDFWLFGYGSLIWKPPPHFDQRVPGYIEGYVRRFWQASEDHRGTPSAPGRVVTLIDRVHWESLTDAHEPTERVWGAAYHIPAQNVAEVREYLDLREINGYSIQFSPFHAATITPASTTPASTSASTSASSAEASTETEGGGRATPIRCLVYIGLPSNPQFLGPQDPNALARRILACRGPSGENREYLFNLEESLRGLSEESGDWHVSDLVKRCREIEESEGPAVDKREGDEMGVPLQKVGTTEEVEEVEK